MDDLDLTRILHEQLDFHWRVQARPRLDGLTDEEYRWEPVPGTWNVRHRDEPAPASVSQRGGTGQWLLDWGDPAPGQVPPLTSASWRLGHLITGVLGMRAHSHFGGPPADPRTWAYAGSATDALGQLDAAYAAWSEGVRGLGPGALTAPVGEAEGPWAASPMVELVLHINREAIHHLAEVALLRDLWARRTR